MLLSITEKHISQTRTSLVDTIVSPQGSAGGVIVASDMCGIMDSAVSKWDGNMSHNLAYLFCSASRQHHDVWASQFPFLHSIEDSIPPDQAC